MQYSTIHLAILLKSTNTGQSDICVQRDSIVHYSRVWCKQVFLFTFFIFKLSYLHLDNPSNVCFIPLMCLLFCDSLFCKGMEIPNMRRVYRKSKLLLPHSWLTWVRCFFFWNVNGLLWPHISSHFHLAFPYSIFIFHYHIPFSYSISVFHFHSNAIPIHITA